MNERKRKVEVESLSIEQATELSEQISKKVNLIREKAQMDINRILNIYGMHGLVEIKIDRLTTEE